MVCAGLVVLHPYALITNVQRGRMLIFFYIAGHIMLLCYKTYFGHHQKGRDCWKGELLQLICRWFWWCPSPHVMWITSLKLVLFC